MSGAPRLRILADDLTGALDSAAAFDGEVPVHFAPPPAGDADSAVSAVATATRDLAPDALPAALAPALAWLRGADLAFKKVDSLWRGNTMDEVRLAARLGGYERIVFAPAFPQQGRLTVAGRLVLAPGPGAAAAAGVSAVEALADAGVPVEVPDVRDEADLLRLALAAAEPAARRWLWCGSAGLAHALAGVLQRPARSPAAMAGAGARPLVLVSASHQAVLRRQWVRLLAGEPQAAVAQGGEPSALQAALARLRAGADLAFLDLSPRESLAPQAAADLLARQLDALAQHAPRPGVLVVVGGDTLLALCRATGARGLRASAAVHGGWGQARWIGGPWDGLACHTRSGAFGADDDLLRVVRALR